MPRRTILALLILVLFTVANGYIITRRILSGRASSPARMRLDHNFAERANRLRAWEKEKLVPLTSPSLAAELESLLEDKRIPASPWAEHVPQATLGDHQKNDLYQAISGILKAFATNSPRALVEYMRARQMHLAPDRRRVICDIIEKHLREHGSDFQRPPESLSDSELYQQFWAFCEVRCCQETLLPTASRLTIWKWKNSDPGPILDASSLAQLREIPDVWPGYVRVSSNFTPMEPHTLMAQLRSKQEFVIADVELIIGHDKQLLFRKSPYMVRFWYNEAHGKWQPLMLIAAYTSSDDGFPSFGDFAF